jgi:eukaryotic-like serine/threonine-protein kinase
VGVSADLIGQTLGRYQITSQLGEGGMATIYKAFDAELERYVAIKVLRPDISQASDFLERFKREARALARLSHPNIVPVLDFGEYIPEGSVHHLPYLVMEYVPGGALRRVPGFPVPPSEAAKLLAPIARALALAHSRGIIHRDVKPANFLVAEDGRPMLSDFGIAKMLETESASRLTREGVGIGTPEYMAPEQGQGGEMDQRVDIYALGVVFYELVVGRVPFEADTPLAIVIKHINDPLPPPRQINPELPEAAEKILLKALAKNPNHRFGNMELMAAALDKLASGAPLLDEDDLHTSQTQPVETMHSSQDRPIDTPAAPVRKRRSPALMAVIAAVILTAVCCLGTWGLYIGDVCISDAMPWCAAEIPEDYNRVVCPPPGNWPLPPWCVVE